MNQPFSITRDFHITRKRHGQKKMQEGRAPETPAGKIPRLARLMALAIHCDQLIRAGVADEQAELARRGHITTARMAQIMSLLNLAPELQEELLFLPRTPRGRDALQETDIRPIVRVLDWREQRRLWAKLPTQNGK